MTKTDIELPTFNDEDIDKEVLDLVKALNANGIYTESSCSGHGKEYGHIALKDGRWLVVLPKVISKDEVCSKLAM